MASCFAFPEPYYQILANLVYVQNGQQNENIIKKVWKNPSNMNFLPELLNVFQYKLLKLLNVIWESTSQEEVSFVQISALLSFWIRNSCPNKSLNLKTKVSPIALKNHETPFLLKVGFL
ncbi:hypothetical protein BpHYR1_007572 [Brachionus plicatilis]|uniref:Uncharacterized protein n=1 Tax=Brachionus plicatilis TaxID=10195 RepID=A0A3M7TAR7_BRAPC|nr:hypothetical protein BpHYR1_007572 [Brachionus plicatilis]